MHPTIQKFIRPIEKISLATLCVSLALKLIGVDVTQLLIISFNGLAIAFFLSAFQPIAPASHNESKTFSMLLTTTVLPRVLWISASVATIGLLFFVMNLEQGNHQQLLMISIPTMMAAALSLIVLKVSGAKYADSLIPILYRVVPLLVISIYVFYSTMK